MLDVLIAAAIHLSGNYGIGNDTVVLDSSASCPLNTVDTGQTTGSGAEICETVNQGAVVIGGSNYSVVQTGWNGLIPVQYGGAWGLNRGGHFFGGGFPGHHGPGRRH
jgi:hypothetical protein